MARAVRSLTEPPGFSWPHLTKTMFGRPAATFFSSISGVLPIAWMTSIGGPPYPRLSAWVRHPCPRVTNTVEELARHQPRTYRGHEVRCICTDDFGTARQQRGRDLRAAGSR